MKSRLFFFVCVLLLASNVLAVPVLPVEVVTSYPHDRTAFTQGLVIHEGRLFESTGLYGRSTLREVDLARGTIQRQVRLDRREFGEGITVYGGRIYQLTWANQRAYVYDLDTFEQVRRFSYRGEGWGLTNNGEHLIMSDGSAELRFLDPATFRESHRVTVTADGEPLPMLNELVYMDGRVYANVWLTTRVAIIEPVTGEVEAFLDLQPLIPHLGFEPRMDYESPNGIAYDETTGRFFATGKLWPLLFEIRWTR